jgi:hypothetical protein
MITVADINGTSGTVTVEQPYEVVRTIRDWFPDAPEEVHDALDQLDQALNSRQGSIDDWCTYLGIKIDFGA